MMIESSQNKIVKKVKSLYTKKARDAFSQFVAEGVKLVDCINKNIEIEAFICSEDFVNANSISLYDKTAKCYIVSDKVFNSISDTVTPQGILAICRKPNPNIDDVLNAKNPVFLVLDEISDPGNLGTIIRSAEAFGATAVFILENSADLFNPKTVRATMGSIFNVPIFQNFFAEPLINAFRSKNISIIATSLQTENTISSISFNGGSAIVIGNESRGISNLFYKLSDDLIKIPMTGNAQSLNAAISASIILYEIQRQRMEFIV